MRTVQKDEFDELKESAHRTKDEVKANIKRAKKLKVVLSILKLTILAGIVIAIPLYVYFFQKTFSINLNPLTTSLLY